METRNPNEDPNITSLMMILTPGILRDEAIVSAMEKAAKECPDKTKITFETKEDK